MLSNDAFLVAIREGFAAYLAAGSSSRSTAKLKPLHSYIATDLIKIFGQEYTIKSQGIGDDKEGHIEGRYYDKNVDITVYHNGVPVAGYAVKFVVRNYSQNSNNYFENMLGETANIRVASIPYFQVFIVFDKVPYYKDGGILKKYECVSQHNLDKYIVLSRDNPDAYFHIPDKTLLVIIKLKEKGEDYPFETEDDYAEYYKTVIRDQDLMKYSDRIEDQFDSGVILNNYADFIERTYHIIKGKEKE